MNILNLGLFSFGSRMPAVQQAEEAPSVNDKEVEEAKRKERELARRRSGRQSTILTGPSGVADTTQQKATLLGG